MDFSFFYDPVEGHMYAGFYANINYYSEHHYGTFYSEPRAISYIAIGKGDVPKEHWFMLARTFPDTWLWQTQMPRPPYLELVLSRHLCVIFFQRLYVLVPFMP